MNDGKQYVFQFNVDNSALNSAANKIETRLSEAMRNGMSLDRSGKAEVKQSLSQIFGIAEEQAETLRKAMQGIVSMKPEGVKDLKNQLKETLDFVSGIMTQMKKVNASTDWMKQGVGFVDSFKTLQTALDHTQKTVSGLEVSVGELKSSFQGFADAFKANDPSAYFKKFGDGVDSVVSRMEGRLTQAKKSIESLIKSGDIATTDYSGFSVDELNDEYKYLVKTLSDLDAKMSTAKAGTKEYEKYLRQSADALADLQEINKLLPKNASQGMNTATTDVVATIKKAGDDLKHTITNLKLDNIKLSVELPDAKSAEFGAKINAFVAEATKQFQTKPISVSLDITNPFKNLDGEELSKTQKKIADRAVTEANKSLKKITGATDTSESVALTGNASADRILRSFQNSFKAIEAGLKSGQTSIKDATKQWRTEMDELLKLRFTWEKTANTNEVQQMFDKIQEIADMNPIHLTADTVSFVDDIQEALKEARISINANIDNATITSVGAMQNIPMVPIEVSTPTPTAKESSLESSHIVAELSENSNSLGETTKSNQTLVDTLNTLNANIEKASAQVSDDKKSNSRLTADTRRRDAIDTVVKSGQDPASLVLTPLDDFYTKTEKTMVEATKKAQGISERIATKNKELSVAEDELKKLGKNTDSEAASALRGKIAQLKSDITGLTGELRDTNKKYDTANARRNLLEQKGFKDVRNLEDNERISFVTNLLKQSDTLADQLSKSSMRIDGSDVKLSLTSLQDLIYFIPEIQKTLGVAAKTTDQWSHEKGLQEKFVNIFKLANQLDALNGISKKNGVEPTNEAIQEFIRVFEHVPVMAKVIEEAKNYLEKSLALSGYNGKSKTKIATLTSEKDTALTSLMHAINGKWYDTTVDGQESRKYVSGAKDEIRSMLNSQEPIHVKVVGSGTEKTYGLKQNSRSGNQDVTERNFTFAGSMRAAKKFGIDSLLSERFDVGRIVDTMDSMSAERTAINRNLALLSEQEKIATDAEKSMLQKEQEELNARLEYIKSFLLSGDNIAQYKDATRRMQEIDAEIAKKVEISTKKNAPTRMSRRGYETYTSQIETLKQEKAEKLALLKSLEDEDSIRATWTAKYQKQLDSKEINQGQYDKLVQGISGAIQKSKEATQTRIDEIDKLLELGNAQDEAVQKLQVLNNNIAINKAKVDEAKKSVKEYEKALRNGFTEGSNGKAWAYEKVKHGHMSGAIGQFGKVFTGDYTKSVDMNEERWADFKYRLQSAKETGTMDAGIVSGLEEMISVREAAMKELDGMTQSQQNTTEGKEKVKQLKELLVENSRKKILQKYYETEGWFLNDLLSQRLKNIDLEFEREKKSVQSGSVDAESQYSKQIDAENKRYAQQVAQIQNQYAASSSAYTLDTQSIIRADIKKTEEAFQEAYAPIFKQAHDNFEKSVEHITKVVPARMLMDNAEYKKEHGKFLQLEKTLRAETRAQFTSPLEKYQNMLAELPSTDGLQGQKKAAIEQKRAEIETLLNNYIGILVEKHKRNLIASFNQTRGEGEKVTSLEEIQKILSEGLDVALKDAAQVNAENLKKILPSGVKTDDEIKAEVDQLALVRDAQKVDAISGVMSGSGYISDMELMRQQTEQARQSAQKTLDAEKSLLKNREQQRDGLIKEHGITDEMLQHSQNVAQNQQKQAQVTRQTANVLQQQSSAGGQYQYSGGVGGYFNTNGLATESTLRGIYTLLNGAPPTGGWGDESVDERDVVATQSKFAESMSRLLDSYSGMKTEAAAIIGKDGQLGGLVQGQKSSISGQAIQSALAQYVRGEILAVLHNHPSGANVLSEGDVKAAYLRAYTGKHVKMSGSVTNEKMTTIDFSGIDKEAASRVPALYSENLKKLAQAMPEWFAYDKKLIVNADVLGDPETKKQIDLCINSALKTAFSQIGHSNAFKQIDVSNMQGIISAIVKPAQEQVAVQIAQSGVQAAVDATNTTTTSTKYNNIKELQTSFQSQFKTKELASGKKGFDIAGANKIDQALYNVGDRLSKASGELTDKDITKLATAYDQLTKGLQDEIAKHLDADTIAFLNNLKSQISSVLGANAPRIEEKSQASDAIKEAKSYLSQLKTEDGKKVSGASRAKTGIDQVYRVLNNGKSELSNADLTSLGQGYYRLQETVNHAVFKKLDENTKKVINEAITKAKEVLDKYGVTVSGHELVGTVLDDANKSLYTNANKTDKTQKAGRKISSIAEPQISKDDKVISKASVYLDGTSTKQAIEKAEAEDRVASAKQKQQELSEQIVNADAEATKQAEKKAEVVNNTTPSTPSTISAEPVDTHTDTLESSGGLLGILNQLAKDATVQQILTALNNGVKPGGSDGKQSGDGKKKSLNIGADEALEKMIAQVNADYPGAVRTGSLRATAKGYSIDFWRDNTRTQQQIQEKINKLESEGKTDTDEYKSLVRQKTDLLKIQEKINKLEAEGKANTDDYNDLIQQRTSFLQKQEKITLSINKDTGKITSKVGIENFAVGANAAEKELQHTQGILSQLQEADALQFNPDGSLISQNKSINNWIQSMQALQVQRDKLASEGTLFDSKNQQDLSQMTAKTAQYRKEVMELLRVESKFGGNVVDTFANPQALAGQDELYTKLLNIATATGKVDMTTVKYDRDSSTLSYTIEKSKNQVQAMTLHMNSLSGAVTQQTGELRHVDTAWQKFGKSLGAKFQEVGRYLLSFGSIYRVWGMLKQGVGYIQEIDNALTELRKVTDATDREYAQFLQTMSKTAGVVGSTTSELTKSAADWSRLGYSMQEAGELAKSTAILMNVSEFDNVETATEALISSLQAFNYTADDSIKIVDKLNIVGNNFAISSDGIAEGLQRSASTLVAAGNSLEQSIAMLAAGNKVAQDPEALGNALKVLSMRIRGTKTDLEEAGEETDGLIENTSKLREKVKALTNVNGNGGVDILTDTGAYRSTYDILLDIAEVWDDINDADPKNQAALLEILAGKTRGSQLAAILQNPEDLRDAYEMALESEGSAAKELETYLDSIQGKMQTFTNSIQTMWMNLLDSEVIKFFVDLGTKLVNLADKIGVIRLLFMGMTTIFMRKSGITSIGEFVKAGAISAEEASKKLAELKTKYAELEGSKSQKNLRKQDKLKSQMKPYDEIVEGAAKAKKAQDNLAKAQNKLQTAEANLANAQKNNFKPNKIKKYQQAVDSAKVEVTKCKEEVQKCEIANKNLGNSALLGWNKFKAGALGALKTLGSVLKQMLEMYAITAILDVLSWAGEGIVNFFDGMHETAEEAQEKLDELKNELEAIESEIDSLNSELETTNDAIDELMDKGTLSFAEQEELNRLKAISAELEKQIQFQETLKEAKSKAVNAQAVTANSKYLTETSFYSDKSKTERQDEAKTKGENIGNLVGLALGIGASFIPGAQAFAPAIIGGLSAAGKWIGGMIGSSSAGDEYDSEQSVADALSNIKETRKKFEAEIQDAMANGDTEAYNEATEALNNYDAKMADHMSVIAQNANSFDWETATEKDKQAMQEQLNLLDAYNIAMGSQDAKANALDRLFGENASEVVKAYRATIEDDIENGKAVDFQEMIDVTGLDDDLDALGLTTKDVADYFTKLGEAGADAVEKIDFSDVVSELAKIEEALGSVKSVMEEFRAEGIVSASTLEGMQEEFGGLGEAWENYVETMMSGTATMAEVQAATEALAKAYLDQNANDINKNTKLTYIAQLEQFGVDNAKDLVNSYINNSFWNSNEFENFKGNAEELIELAKEYGITIEDTEKAVDLLSLKESARATEAMRNEQKRAAATVEYQQQQRRQQILSSNDDLAYYVQDYQAATTRTGRYGEGGTLGGYDDADIAEAIEHLKTNIETTLLEMGYSWEDIFPDASVVPEITVSQAEVDAAEKRYQELLDEMGLTVTPDINFNKNTALEETAEAEEAFASLKDVYDEFKEHNIVSAKSLVGLEEAFGNVEGFENFTNILGDSTSTIEQVTTAIQGLANGFLNDFDYSKLFDADGLLDESEVKRVASQLENIGVANANEFIRQKAWAYNKVKEMYGIDLTNYESAEDAKNGYLIQSVIAQIENTGKGMIDGFAEQYKKDLENYGETWEEKVQCAKDSASKILEANKASEISSLDAKFEERMALVNGDGDVQRAESWYERELARIKKKYSESAFSIDSIVLPEINTSDIFTYYKPTTIDPNKLGGNDDKDGSDSDTELDWLDHYFTKIENKIKEKEAELENIMAADVGSVNDKNTIVDGIIGLYESKIPLLETAINAYQNRATALLNGFSSDIQAKIRNGSIDINEYDDELAEDIQNYFDYITQASDLGIELDSIKVTIADFSLQKFDNASTAFDNEIEEKFQSDQDVIEAEIGYLEEQGKRVSPELYEKLINIQKEEQKVLENKKKTLENILAAEIAAGRIQIGSKQWYEMVNAINDVDEALIESKNDIESFRNSINEIYWNNFEKLVGQLEAVNSELSNLFDLLSEDDKVVDEFGNWTDEGIASLGLLAQQMENAKAKANEYAKAIKDLEDNRDAYSLDEYNEKMAELKDNYLSEIKNLEDAKDAMVDLNKVRIDAVKEAIDKEIEALEEKNEKLKEELALEKEQYDFQKQVTEQEKSMADIQRRLNALAGDSSASAIAERRKLQAELAEAQQEMDDMWYEHSIEEQQKSLDESLENYKENKEDEKEALDKWLEDEEKVIKESFDLFNSNVDIVSSVLEAFEEEHGIKLTEAIVNPWNSGIDAMTAYRNELEKMKQEQADAKQNAEDTADDIVESLDKPEAATPPVVTPSGGISPSTGQDDDTTPSYREYTVKKNDTLSDIAQDELGSASRWQEIYNLNKDVISNPDLIYPGQKIKLPHYAKGTMGAKYDHFAMVDELGPELQLVPDGSGRLSYITRGTSVIPHDLSEKLVDLALDPTKVLEHSRPAIGAPHITTNNFDIDLSFGSLVHVDHCDQNTLPDLQKMVRGEFDNMMKTLNQKLKRK